MKKRFISSLLALVMVLSCFTAPVNAQSALPEKLDPSQAKKLTVTEEDLQGIREALQKAQEEGKLAETLKLKDTLKLFHQDQIIPAERLGRTDDQRVRVVVVLKGDSLLQSATEQGKKVRELTEEERNALTQSLTETQAAVKTQLAEQGVYFGSKLDANTLPADESYTAAFNGFSTYVASSDIETIRQNPNVEDVYIAQEYYRPVEPDMKSSNAMIGSQAAHDLGYSGEGQLVAVIDSGTDATHSALSKLPEGTTPAYTEEQANARIAEAGLPGIYLNEKVPYAYNYYDQSALVKDIGADSQHGQHVAGTVAGNGADFKGVAPAAQVMGMKVFSDDILYSTTFSDIYVKAIDDAIAFGADVINMSLGSSAGRYVPGSIEDLALSRAREAGITSSISAGNEHTIMDGVTNFANALNVQVPYAQERDADIGIVGSPSVNEDSLSVASAENTHVTADKLIYHANGEDHETAVSIASSSPDPTELFDGPKEIVPVGSAPSPGKAEDWANVDVKGKIALVMRGNAFTDTLANAQKAGAAGLIVYNHADGGEALVSMAGGDQAKIAFAFIGHAAGTALAADKDATVTFTDEKILTENPKGSRISDFSSWGPTPDLGMKPEITAPGGQIYSIQNNEGYTSMSGTSMAAPHASGGAAIIKQYIETDPAFKALNLTEAQRADMVKTLMMNTATHLTDENGVTYFVRQQGAGLMNLAKAVTTKQYVLNAETNKPKVELGSFAQPSFNVSLTVTNLANEEVSYSASLIALKDTYTQQNGMSFNVESPSPLDATLSGDTEFSVPANGSKTVNYTVSFTDLEDKHFVDAFIDLNAKGENHVSLTMPILGFYGDWESLPIMDGYLQDKDSEDLSKRPTFMLTTPFRVEQTLLGGMGDLHIADPYGVNYISRGKDLLETQNANFGFLGTVLRNFARADFAITDANGKVLRQLESTYDGTKIKNMARGNSPMTPFVNALWDGTIGGEALPDGQTLYYDVKFYRSEDSQPQEHRFELLTDSTAPVVNEPVLENGIVHVTAHDETSGGDRFAAIRIDPTYWDWIKMIIPDDRFSSLVGGPEEYGGRPDFLFEEGKTEYALDVRSLMSPNEEGTLALLTFDKAGNATQHILKLPKLTEDIMDPNATCPDPVIDPIYSDSDRVTGKTVPYATVTFYTEDTSALTTTSSTERAATPNALTPVVGRDSEVVAATADKEGKIDFARPEVFTPGMVLKAQAAALNGAKSGYVDVSVLTDKQPTKLVTVMASLNGEAITKEGAPEGFDLSTVRIQVLDEYRNDYTAQVQNPYTTDDSEMQMISLGELKTGRKYTIVVDKSSLAEGYDTARPTFVLDDNLELPVILKLTKKDESTTPEERPDDPNTQAQIQLQQPGLLEAYKDEQIPFNGRTWGMDNLNKLEIDVKEGDTRELKLTENKEKSVVLNNAEVFYGRNYTFDEKQPLDNGYYEMPFRISNGTDNFQIVRRFWVDRELPRVEDEKIAERKSDDPTATIQFTAKDNMNMLKVFRDDQFIGTFEKTDDGFKSKDIEQRIEDTVQLKPGKNVFVYHIFDLAGNEYTHEVTINYVDKELLKKTTELAEKVPQPSQELADLIKSAHELIDNPDATQEQVDEMVEKLIEALKAVDPQLLSPVILGTHNQTVNLGETIDLKKDVQAQDAYGKDLTDRIKVEIRKPNPEIKPEGYEVIDEIDTKVPGEYEVVYSVTDDYGNTTIEHIHVSVVQAPVSTLLLEGALKAAKELPQDPYTDASKAALNEAIQKAEELLAAENKTQEQIDEATNALLEAIGALQLKANTAALEQSVEDAKKALDEGKLTKESKEAIEKALADAQAILADPNATQEAVDQANATLRDALNNATYKPDTSKLEGLIEEANKLIAEGKLTPASKAALEKAIEAAKAVLDADDVTPKQLEDAALALSEAIRNAHRSADTTRLEAAVKTAEQADLTNATELQKQLLNNLLEQAKAALANPEVTQQLVDTLATQLETLLASLGQPVPEQPGKPDPEKPEPGQPGKPDPEKPEPGQPGKPDPEKPAPGQPEKPNPEKPTPGTGNTTQPKVPTTGTKASPKTGDAGIKVFAIVLAGAATAYMVLRLRKKEQ